MTMPKLGDISVYASARVADALEEISAEMPLYHGVRLAQVLEAAYEQGRKDGRAQVFDALDGIKANPDLKHRNPGRPKNPLKRAKKAVKAVKKSTP